MYNKNFDHALRNLARANKGAEECAENDSIKEEWDKVIAVRDNEILEANVKDKMDVDKEENAGEGDTALSQMRRPATEFTVVLEQFGQQQHCQKVRVLARTSGSRRSEVLPGLV